MNLRKVNELFESAKAVLAEASTDVSLRGTVRVNRGETSIRVTDMTNAGRRGKTVNQFAVYQLDMMNQNDKAKMDRLAEFEAALKIVKDYAQAEKLALAFMSAVEDPSNKTWRKVAIEHNKLRGIDVKPESFQKLVIDTPEFRLEADHGSFSVSDKRDTNNEPCIITPARGSKLKAAKIFYDWAKKNEAQLKRMTFDQVYSAMNRDKISSHYFCRMD